MKLNIGRKPTELDKEIDRLIQKMSEMSPDTDEYTRAAKNLESLYRAKKDSAQRKVSADTITGVVGNLVGIGMIIGYERIHCITTKALGMVGKRRV